MSDIILQVKPGFLVKIDYEYLLRHGVNDDAFYEVKSICNKLVKKHTLMCIETPKGDLSCYVKRIKKMKGYISYEA